MIHKKKYKGAQALLKSLSANGVKTIFGYPGGVLLGLYDEIYNQDEIRHILVRHEQGAVHAADAYARVSGKAGVCLATSGPGATNLLTGICNAQMDSAPLIALTGQVSSELIGKDAFQEADLFNLSLAITKHNYLLKSPENIASTISQAFKIAQSGRPGPVLVDMPKDVLNSSFEWDGITPDTNVKGLNKIPALRNEDIDKACEMILNAERPVLYIGGGIIISGASEEIKVLSEKYNIPLVWSLMAKGAMPDTHELNLGMLGMHGTVAANFAIHDSDLLIAIGTRFDDRATGKLESFAPNAKVIHVDIDPAEIGKNRKIIEGKDLSISADAKKFLIALLEKLTNHINLKKDSLAWVKKVQTWKKEYPLDCGKNQKDGILSPQKIFCALNKVLSDAIYTTSVGQHQMWSAQYINLDKPRRWVTSGGLGTMGFGLPAAIGAKIAVQDMGKENPVVCISGDGSFQMCPQELGTLASHNIPVICVIFNNGNLGMVRQWQEFFFGRRYSFIDLSEGAPDYVKLAEAYGIKGIRSNSPDELEDIFKTAVSLNKPVLIDLKIPPEASVLPIVPPDKSISKPEGINKCIIPTDRDLKDYLEDVKKSLTYKFKDF